VWQAVQSLGRLPLTAPFGIAFGGPPRCFNPKHIGPPRNYDISLGVEF
jgi:hypothetical protein